MGLALNEKASFSFGYQHSVVSEMSQDGRRTPERRCRRHRRTQLGTRARFGLTYAVTRQTAVNLSLGIGVTRETPDPRAHASGADQVLAEKMTRGSRRAARRIDRRRAMDLPHRVEAPVAESSPPAYWRAAPNRLLSTASIVVRVWKI